MLQILLFHEILFLYWFTLFVAKKILHAIIIIRCKICSLFDNNFIMFDVGIKQVIISLCLQYFLNARQLLRRFAVNCQTSREQILRQWMQTCSIWILKSCTLIIYITNYLEYQVFEHWLTICPSTILRMFRFCACRYTDST